MSRMEQEIFRPESDPKSGNQAFTPAEGAIAAAGIAAIRASSRADRSAALP